MWLNQAVGGSQPLPPSLGAVRVTHVWGALRFVCTGRPIRLGCHPPLCHHSALRESSAPPRPEGFAGRVASRCPSQAAGQEATRQVWEKGRKEAFRDRPGQGGGKEPRVGVSEEGGVDGDGGVGS